MSKENNTSKNNNNGGESKTSMNNNNINNNNNLSRACDTCQSAACKVYCHADSAYLCYNCDTTIHSANRVASRHERVLVCEACESAPATFLCKADSASLCSSCDSYIHSANPLASRHQRFPLLPFTGCSHHHLNHDDDNGTCDVDEAEDEVASWLLANPLKNNEENDLFDEYLDFVDCNSCGDGDVHYDDDDDNDNHQHNYRIVPQKNYDVVPFQCGGGGGEGHVHLQQQGFDFESSKSWFSYDGSLSQTVSVSSMDNMGVVPDSTISDISVSRSNSWIGTNDLFPPIPMPSHLITPMDREAKVLRYREKKKTRKFEKKIRYVSRKAYAENRPRIKGRFAKRTNVESDQVDHMHSTTLIGEAECSIVPSFLSI